MSPETQALAKAETRAVAKALHAEICGCEQGQHAASYREAARAAIKALRAYSQHVPPPPAPRPERLPSPASPSR